MSFAEKEEIYRLTEGLIGEIFSLDESEVNNGFQVLSYNNAMERFGTDKPDLRIPFEIRDFSQSSELLNSNIFNSILGSGGTGNTYLLRRDSHSSTNSFV